MADFATVRVSPEQYQLNYHIYRAEEFSTQLIKLLSIQQVKKEQEKKKPQPFIILKWATGLVCAPRQNQN